MGLPADVAPPEQVVFDPECRSCLFFRSCHLTPPFLPCITIGTPKRPCAVGLSAADGPGCLCTGSACGHPFSERGKSRKSLSRPALRGGVVRAGAPAAPALYPARFSTGGSTSSQTAYSALRHSSSPNRSRCAGMRFGVRGSPVTRAARRVLERGRGNRPPCLEKGHTGPHGRQRGALCLYSTVCFFSVLISSLFFLFYPIAL